MDKIWSQKAASDLAAVREKRPLVHVITNFVAMNYTADVLLAMGALPVMAFAFEEVEEIVRSCSALVVNIGTLTRERLEAMLAAAKIASQEKIPVILDPVGAGAAVFRTVAALEILQKANVSVVKGNASEILALSSDSAKTKGVDALHSVQEAEGPAITMARKWGNVFSATGPVDLITDGRTVVKTSNGHSMMGLVTGSGCAVSAVMGAFASVDSDPVAAAASALAYFGLAGQVASESAKAPGAFRIALLDALYTITPEKLQSCSRITKV